MCDCYGPSCSHPGCENIVEMHLGDYLTGRDEVEIYCHFHIPKDISTGVLFGLAETPANQTEVFLKYLTDNARKNWDVNHPNVSYPFCVKKAFGKSLINAGFL